MHLLTRVCLQNWYLVDAIDVEIVGSTALVGPTGAGKSSFADAIQTVLTGANMNRLNLNPSASGKSARSVLEYCLGMTRDPAEGGEPLRRSCETVIALVFRDEETAEPLTVGIALSARFGDSREEVLSRFIAPNFAYSVGDAKRRGPNGGVTLAPWSETVAHLRRSSEQFEEYRSSAEKFTTDMLRRMRGFHNQAPNARHFLRSFSNALAFKPIFDSTLFVREFVLEPEALDLDRVRTSIDTWKQLEAAIEQIEAKLKRVVRMETRFGTWAETKLKGAEARFVAAQAEMRRTAHDYRSSLQVLRSKTADLEQTRQALSTRRRWVAEFDEEIRSKRILADAGDAGARMRQLENERRYEEREVATRSERYRKVRNAISLIARLSPVAQKLTPSQRRAIEAAAEALRMLPDAMDPADALHGKGERLQPLLDEIAAAEGLVDIMNGLADQIADDLRDLQARAESITSNIGPAGSDRAILSPSTRKLIQGLERKGWEAIPVCDVVEVIDEDWREAVESLLGWARESIIVDPKVLHQAYAFANADRESFGGTNFVSTVQTPGSRASIRKGSILEAVTTDNDHAFAFMETRIGSFIKAGSDEEMAKMSRGVTRDGKTSSGMALSVNRRLTTFMLGKAARRKTGDALRNELAPLLERLAAAREEVKMLREAARVIGPAIDVLRDGESLFDMEHSARMSRQRLKAISEDMLKGDTSDAAAILDEIRAMEQDRANHIEEIDQEYQPRMDALVRDVARAESKENVARDALRKAVKDRSVAWRLFRSPLMTELGIMRGISDIDSKLVLKRTRRTISEAERERDDVMGFLSTLRNDSRTIADQADRDSGREQANAIREFGEYAANWDMDVPRIEPDTMIDAYRWTAGERARLEGNELRRHREACLNAASEMRKMLREDLLARLSEKLEKVHHKMEALNERMQRHHFTGQVYSYTWTVNGRFARMYELAMRVGSSDGIEALEIEAELDEALVELDDLIAGKDGSALLADYRQYFTFEIVMTDAQGRRTSMSSRAVKGSGGEAQAPFYVAMAASLAAAYFPGHSTGRPTGMGLAMFDEAFNKLDVVNTQALLNFFTDMGLQLMIAGPEEKRAAYTEVLDTIVLVNKSLDGTSVLIDAEHPGARARAALGEINPDHVGVEAFRTGTGA
ncbi:SbcC/MukB-like Walker B domain-containing protein [Rhizobium sp. BK176]|uniref:SbcC/MukB-like Walker B domain-containing protein n=1 Tax=Rhizobium sp. BK176 TaxID=2587071 RepID=UPI002167C952|nr:SbcC/MukB-like Walker B domain-containing protein [Rhizobium sp. BK176]MCS4090010.1 energy-coupling factor transporter ATP-binding protein EcfA2 [Rhizobium sp. BK176]